jgi:diaminohydroxyphosphoribosylaminopyrimidine deaminase / 5-amino-6-(5-phosphoribosylamino)uracil reductase
MTIWSPTDIAFMEMALELAARQLGKTGSNPAVGCVIVKDGQIIGQGATANCGRPHGEAMALATVVGSTSGATVFVTLEPCAHVSARGPDCAGSLIEAGIARLVCCLEDPDPRTSGRGFDRLVKAGVKVEVGLLADKGAAQIADFQP